MTDIGQVERMTQDRVVRLLRDDLGYEYLGDWRHRDGNSNIEESLLQAYLKSTGRYSDALINRAIEVLKRTAGGGGSLYERNQAVYELLRYGIKVKEDIADRMTTVWPIDWSDPANNRFGVAEEVALRGAEHGRRPDVVLYVNGIALVLIELKRSKVAVEEGIRQNISSQKPEFIEPFFTSMQLITAGNDTQGLRYGTIGTPQKYYLVWKRPSEEAPDDIRRLDWALIQMFSKERLLEIVHDFVVFDAGTKKVPRHNQYFGVRAAQDFVDRRQGGIIWHTQGSGKSLTMVWLAKWILERDPNARVLVVTDRTELDDQIEGVFLGVNEKIRRVKSGADLLELLDSKAPRLMCTLIHKFGSKPTDENIDTAYADFIEQLEKSLPAGFEAKGNIYVFVDECHRTQSGLLHQAMQHILPDATLIGFTGTPLLKSDKKRSIEVFGPYIHTYKFDEAVRDEVIVDLKYEARNIAQRVASQEKVDEWFDARTDGLSDAAKARLKQRWGTIKEVSSSRERLNQIAADIQLDMMQRPRLASGQGNALLVCSSIYEACVYYEIMSTTDLKGHCAIVTSYRPNPADVKGEDAGEGDTLPMRQYEIYRQMLSDWFGVPKDQAMRLVDEFETAVIEKFVEEPGQMKLLIVVDKLLTGFDAPPATYLYIDKKMADHGLFQAICRVNRIDTEDKEYGYIIDYMDLFRSLESAVADYTAEAFDAYDKQDVEGLLENRVATLRGDLEEVLEVLRALVEPVEPPKDSAAHIKYFCGRDPDDTEEVAANSRRRLILYRIAGRAVRIFAEIAPDYQQAGYSKEEIEALRAEIDRFSDTADEIRLASGDYVDLKAYEPGMRQLLDNYIKADPSKTISTFDDIPFLELLIARQEQAIDELPEGIKKNKEAVAEAIEGNVRRKIVDENPVNPRYYEAMSELLEELIRQRRADAIAYEEYLKEIIALASKVQDSSAGGTYPDTVRTPGQRALYLTLEGDEQLTVRVDAIARGAAQDGWRDHQLKTRRVRLAVHGVLLDKPRQLEDEVMDVLKANDEY